MASEAEFPGRERIALIGARCSGKSSVGPVLARRLGWSSVDADALLEERAGQSIRSLFAMEGEEGFRDRESLLLAEICRLPRHVLAMGGGVILRPENRAVLQRSAWVVWLTADVQTLSKRLCLDESSVNRRPSLSATANAAAPEEITELLRIREPLYRACADAIVATADRTPTAIADEITELREAYLNRTIPDTNSAY